MSRALLIIDVQNDFTEGGALGTRQPLYIALRLSRDLCFC